MKKKRRSRKDYLVKTSTCSNIGYKITVKSNDKTCEVVIKPIRLDLS